MNSFFEDREKMILMLLSGEKSLKDIPKEYAYDIEAVRAAVTYNGYSLKYAQDEFKNDKEVVLEAVSNKGEAIMYASEQLKKYRIKEGFDVPSHESGVKLLEYKE